MLAISHPGLLPSAACKASAFPSGFPKGYPNGHNYTFFGAQSHSLHSCSARLQTLLSELARGRPYWLAGCALAKWNFRSAIRFYSQCVGKPCKENKPYLPFSPTSEQALRRGICLSTYAIIHWVTLSNFIPTCGNPNDSDLSGHEH